MSWVAEAKAATMKKISVRAHPHRGGYEAYCHQHANLHGDYPPALAAEYVNERAPEGFYHPRQADEAGEQREGAVVHSEVLEHDQGNGIDDKIRDALHEVEGWHPEPCRSVILQRLHLYNSVAVSACNRILRRPLRRRLSGTGQPRVPSRCLSVSRRPLPCSR